MEEMYVLVYGTQSYYADSAKDALRVYNAVGGAEILYGTPGHYVTISIDELESGCKK